jgi:hypothetical protein
MIPMVVFCLLGPRAGVASTVVVMLEAWLFFYISSSGTPATTLCSWRFLFAHAPSRSVAETNLPFECRRHAGPQL